MNASLVERGTFVDQAFSDGNKRRRTTNIQGKYGGGDDRKNETYDDIVNRNTKIFAKHLWINLVINIALLVLLLF